MNTNEHNSSATEGKYWAYDLMRKWSRILNYYSRERCYICNKKERIYRGSQQDAMLLFLRSSIKGKIYIMRKLLLMQRLAKHQKMNLKEKLGCLEGVLGHYIQLTKYNFSSIG